MFPPPSERFCWSSRRREAELLHSHFGEFGFDPSEGVKKCCPQTRSRDGLSFSLDSLEPRAGKMLILPFVLPCPQAAEAQLWRG